MTQLTMNGTAVAAQHMDAGIAHFRSARFVEAVAAFEAVLQLKPGDPYARWNRATALLSLGDYENGFREHEVAWRLFHWRGFGPVQQDIDRLQVLPIWKGERDVRLLAYHELGFGDAIMVFRYLHELQDRTALTLVLDPALARLARSFGAAVTFAVPHDLTMFDCRLPLFGVMSALGTNAGNIPAAPYIAAEARVPARTSPARRIGIAWSGRTQTMFSAEFFQGMLAGEDRAFYALQPGYALGVEPLLAASDFADVADRIAAMDHIVTVDTAAAHLAGAMGHRSAHLVLPYVMDWRWWHVERWYPSLKTYRQPTPHDWGTPFAAVNAAIALDAR